MSNEIELTKTICTDHINDAQCSVQQNSQLPTIEVVNEKGEQLGKGDNIPKPKFPVSLPNAVITTAQKDESDESSESNKPPVYSDQGGYAQTPYYLQQRAGGQPVYVQGRPPPQDASRMPSHQPGQQYYYNNYSDDSIFNDSFDTVVIRNRFVQRVYTILSVQLIYTFGFIAVCISSPKIKQYMFTHIELLLISYVLLFTTLIAMACCTCARRNFPLNFILLIILTMSYSYMAAMYSALYSTQIVLATVGITAGICVSISIFACQTSIDITDWGYYFCITSVGVLIFGIIAILSGSEVMMVGYSILIAILFAGYLMYDTQQIMGGRRIELSPEEYIYGSLTLYLDIMQIFLTLLRILGFAGRD